MNTLATGIGYVVMAAGGILLSAGAFSLALWWLSRRFKSFKDATDWIEAAREWREKHPHKFAKNKARSPD